MEIPEPSEEAWGEKDSEGFLTDPAEFWDRLPQPYRMIDKVLDRLLDDMVWESILKREAARSADLSQEKHPSLLLSADRQLPECTNCLACSGDGRFLAMGHAQGLSVSCASSLACISSWLEDGLEITAVQMMDVGHEVYLIGTLDDMGVARVFALNAEKIHLLKVLNKTEDINQRSVCVTFEVSEGGDFGAALMSCKGALWLDIYHFPLEAWLEDLKQAASQSQKPTSGDVKWTPCSVLMKITPAKIPTGTTLLSPLDLLKKLEVGSGVGFGQNHMISSRQWKAQDAAFRSKYGCDPDHVDDRPCLGTVHFLAPCGASVGSGEEATTHTEAVCLWWTGSHNLLQYSLHKPKNKQDVDPRPAMLWPNAREITCSAISQSSRYIALGLEPDLVSVWDRQTASPLSVVVVSAADGILSRVTFVECGPTPPFSQNAPVPRAPVAPRVHLVASCRSGTTHALTTGISAADARAETLSPRRRDAGCLPAAIASVAFLQGLTLVVQRNGEMLMVDAVSKATVCRMIPPTTHLLACPWAPVFALDAARETLFVRGDQVTGQSAAGTEQIQSHLLVFRFGEHLLFKPRMVAPGDSVITLDTLEQACNRYLQERLLLAGREGNRAAGHASTSPNSLNEVLWVQPPL